MLSAQSGHAQISEGLGAVSGSLQLNGAPADHLGGQFLAEFKDFYWDTPTDATKDTGRGPATIHGAVACDFDGDSFPDLLIAAPGHNSGDGAVYLFYGGSGGVDNTALALDTSHKYSALVLGPTGADHFATDLGAADFNADGYCDLVVGMPLRNSDKGAVYLFLGGPREDGTIFPLTLGSTIDGAANYNLRFNGAGPGDALAYSVATGDVSGDGVADLLIASPYYDTGSTFSGDRDLGMVSVYFGKPAVSRANTSGQNLSLDTVSGGATSFDGYNVQFCAETGYPSGIGHYSGPAENMGVAMAVGDVDGDGVGDVVIGSPSPQLNYSVNGTIGTGSVYVILGGGAVQGEGTVNLGDGLVDFADLNTYHFRFNAVQDWSHFGAALATADLLGDGAADLIVAAPYAYDNHSAGDEAGTIYVIAGDTAWQGMSKVNTQVDMDSIGGDILRISAEQAHDELRSIAAGDIDGDGNADLWIGAPQYNKTAGNRAGQAYVLLGPLSAPAKLWLGDAIAPYDVISLGEANGGQAGLSLGVVGYPCGQPRRYISAPGAHNAAGSVYLLPVDPALQVDSLQKVAGDAQTADTSTLLPEYLSVRALDSYGHGVPCIDLTLVASDGGSAVPRALATDAQGELLIDWTLGASEGQQTLDVSFASASPVQFVATATLACTATGADDDCDGVDQDCSGVADDHYVSSGTVCGLGVCASTGVTSCVAGIEQDSCVAGMPRGLDADCDDVDQDCDGTADNRYVSVLTSCGAGACLASGVTSCVSGVIIDSCLPLTPDGGCFSADATPTDGGGDPDAVSDDGANPDRQTTVDASSPSDATSLDLTGVDPGLSFDSGLPDLHGLDTPADPDTGAPEDSGPENDAGSPRPCDGDPDCCNQDSDCDDGLDCTTDTCSELQRCQHLAHACGPETPCEESQDCLFSDLAIHLEASALTRPRVSERDEQAVVVLKLQTAALGGDLRNLRLRLRGLDVRVLGSRRIQAKLYLDQDGDGFMDPGAVALATGLGAPGASVVEFNALEFHLAPAQHQALLLGLQVISEADAASCAADLHFAPSGAFLVLLILGILRRQRGGFMTLAATQKQTRKTRFVVLGSLLLLYFFSQGACVRTGYLSVSPVCISIDGDEDLQVQAGAGQALRFRGLPAQSPAFDIYL